MTARSYSHGRPTHWTGKQWIYNSTGLIVLDGDLCPCSKCGLHAVVVPLPDDVDTSKEIRTVCIDECIVEHIKDLWAQGYETLSCCCGHGTQRSSVVIGQHHTSEEITKIIGILQGRDDRPWSILQWKLTDVGDHRPVSEL